MTEWQRPGARDAVRTAVRFPLSLALHLKTESGTVEATTKDISSNGLLFVTSHLPTIGSNIEFTMDMPAVVMGWESDVSIHCMGRVVRHQHTGEESMAAAVIDEYFLKAS
jgi:PilZ domain